MNKIYFSFLFIFTCLFSKAQTAPCYFLKDTGTVNTETSNSVTEFRDGTIYVTGVQGNGLHGNDDIALLKFDSCGNVLWIKYYGDSLSNQGLGINKTTDGKLVIIGTTGNASGNNDILFIKLDSSGNILFQKKYAVAANQSAKWIEQTSDKGFIFCGFVADSYGSNDIYVVKIDSVGIVQWTQQVGSTGNEYADAVHETSAGNFIVTGDENSYGAGGYDVEIIKISKTGYIIWDKTFGDRLNNGCQGIIELSNGKYLSYGETETPSSIIFDFFIELVDTSGVSISRHTFGGPAADALFSAVELPGMEFLCTGYSRSYNGFQQYDVVIFKVDSSGQMKWLKDIVSPGIDIGYEIIPSCKRDYLVTGLFGDNNGNYFLTRTDTLGNTTVGVNTISNKNEMWIYPNPFTKDICVSGDQIKSITIIDLLGSKLVQISPIKNNGNCTIDLSYLLPGQYIIQVQTPTGTINRKITKE
ncbi:MAG TPA: T9SS type A sorting domain-containing protein [Bacteroidia bacterium]|jgi:hypothetical protein|nr:T9SS type A sorting domain-containing protein [Bacteroidia bacterium]